MLVPPYLVRVNGVNREGSEINGTGFIVSPGGHIATCLHVIRQGNDNLENVAVYLKGYPGSFRCEVFAFSEEDDLAILKLLPLDQPPPFAVLNPNWEEERENWQSMTFCGHASYKNYSEGQRLSCPISGFSYEDYRVGVDGSINPGDSGGPVIDVNNKVVGVIAQKDRTREGQGRFIPVSLLISLLRKNGIIYLTEHRTRASPTLRRDTLLEMPKAQLKTSDSSRARVFISYKRNTEPDETVAFQVFEALRLQCEVFIDRVMPVGTIWAERIESEIRSSDFFITLISSNSLHSEMVKGEIEKAHQYSKEQSGRPTILPIRLALKEALPYSLGPYLNHINWAVWETHADTPMVIEDLKRALSGIALVAGAPTASGTAPVDPSALTLPLPAAQPAQPIQLDMPEGTMSTESRFYVERPFDPTALSAIRRQGVTITIKGPRQMGKSSLLIRTISAAVQAGKKIAFLDFQLFDKVALANGAVFFRQFCSWLTDALEMEDEVARYWSDQLGNSQRCTRYISRHILKELDAPLVLAMDEVDSIFESDFRSDFFGMLRNWHNNRAFQPIWKRLDLALVTSTEPYQLIENLNQSPFNVGEVIELTDFTSDQVSDLNRRHGSPLNPNEEQRLMELLNGHPYLVRRALYLITSGRMSAAQLFQTATEDRGPFGDHLRYHLFRLHDKQSLVDGLRQVIRHNSCTDDLIFFRLRGAGLVRRKAHKELPRCQLYAEYFREHLHV